MSISRAYSGGCGCAGAPPPKWVTGENWRKYGRKTTFKIFACGAKNGRKL